jgi:hypothetical protein
MKAFLRFLLVLLLVAVWIGAVVYPNPRPFIESISRLKHPPVDGDAAKDLAAQLPDDYKAIEDFVARYVPWKPAWTVYNLPWYFPTVKETIRDKAGDCQAQATLMASILEAKGMPYTLMYSFDHVWVDYPGREVTSLEDPDTSFVADEGGGWLASLPKKFPIGTILKVRIAYHWTPMPFLQKSLIIIGAILIFAGVERRFLTRIARWFGRPAKGSVPSRKVPATETR